MRSLQVIAHSDKPRIEWIHRLSPATKDLWAPDVSYFGGLYHLYYSLPSWEEHFESLLHLPG